MCTCLDVVHGTLLADPQSCAHPNLECDGAKCITPTVYVYVSHLSQTDIMFFLFMSAVDLVHVFLCALCSGPRGLRGPISTTAAAEALDAVLRSEPHRRCVMHRCITPMPLAMPLPFPGIFSPQVSPAGDIITTWAQQQQQQQQEGRVGGSGVNGHNAVSNLSGAGRHPGSHVSTSPVLARLVNSSEFDQVLVHASDALGRASGSASGRALLDAWGYSAADVDDLRERVQELASRYREGESDDEF